MRTASPTARSGQLRRRTEYLPPLDSASQQMERDADATMTLEAEHEYPGFRATPARRPARRQAGPPPQ